MYNNNICVQSSLLLSLVITYREQTYQRYCLLDHTYWYIYIYIYIYIRVYFKPISLMSFHIHLLEMSRHTHT